MKELFFVVAVTHVWLFQSQNSVIWRSSKLRRGKKVHTHTCAKVFPGRDEGRGCIPLDSVAVVGLIFCSPHLWHWRDICACGHFPLCTAPWGPASERMMRLWGKHICLLWTVWPRFFWTSILLFFCCWVSLGLCALRCKQTASNHRPQKPPWLCFSLSRRVFSICMALSACIYCAF